MKLLLIIQPLKQTAKHLCLFGIGGLIYYFIECLWRGYSHWSMICCGGICFVIIGLLNELYTYDMSIVSQMFLSSIVITFNEFIFGCVFNLWLHFNVWDYSNQPYNILGQVCLLYTNLWFLLSIIAILLDDYLRYKLFKEEKPHYKWL